jgi:MinD-like ATPase involved in chromosome partitioning or flagellar assembly
MPMTIVAVAGDAATTTSVAIAAAWVAGGGALLVEADPSGGDVAGWLDLPLVPSLSTLVTSPERTWEAVERHAHLSASGLTVIPAPVRVAEAQQAVAEAERWVVPVMAGVSNPIVVDTGVATSATRAHPFVRAATTVVLVHRQATQSAAAASTRLRRLVDHVDVLSATTDNLIVALIGSRPFDEVEVERSLNELAAVVPLPVDSLAASVLAGARGVSARRLARLPLSKAAARLVDTIGADDKTPSGGRR